MERIPCAFVDEDNLVEKYVCSLYGQPTLKFVNDARLKIFIQKYRPADPEFPVEKIKDIDASMLPPCKDVLDQKLSRCNYVAYLWKHAHLKTFIPLIMVGKKTMEDSSQSGSKAARFPQCFLRPWHQETFPTKMKMTVQMMMTNDDIVCNDRENDTAVEGSDEDIE